MQLEVFAEEEAPVSHLADVLGLSQVAQMERPDVICAATVSTAFGS